jgi:hypothetical protein
MIRLPTPSGQIRTRARVLGVDDGGDVRGSDAREAARERGVLSNDRKQVQQSGLPVAIYWL